METWEQREPGFWVSNFGNMSFEKPAGWEPPAPVALGTLATAAPSNWWDNAERYQGDANSIGSMTSVTNPNTGKAESLVSVNKAGADGVYGQQMLVPYSEYQRLKASDPSWVIDTLKAPGQDMVDPGAWSDIQDAIEATLPAALAFAAPGLSGLLQGATGLSPMVSNALTSAGSSLLTGGDVGTSLLSRMLSRFATAGLGDLTGSIDPSAYDAMQFGTEAGGLVGTGLNAIAPLQVASAGMLNDGPYGEATDMTGFQTPYTEPAFGQENIDTSSYQLPQSPVNPAIDLNAPSSIPPYSGPEPFQTPYTAPFETAVNVQTGGNYAPIPDAQTPVVTPTPEPAPSDINIPPWLLAGGAAAGLGALTGSNGSGTITSGGDVDLTGVGTNPNPYNVDPNAVNAESNSAIAKILAGTATAADWAKVAGQALPGLLGAYASNQQTNALTSLADRYAEYGAPSRARYEASMTPGFDPTTIPGYSGALDTVSNTLLRRLSAQNGNPYGNPGGLIEANKQIVAGTALPAVQNYQNQNANTGGLGALAAAYPQTQVAATNSGSNVWNALGGAASDVFNPKPQATSLADLYKLINSGSMVA